MKPFNPGVLYRQDALMRECVFVTLTILYGCSIGKQPPTDVLAQAEFSVRAAHDASAAELAPMNLRSATDKLDRAKQAMANKRYDDARRFAEDAQVDAELAQAQAEARAIRRAIDGLKGEGNAPPSQAELESREPLNKNSARE
jgi:uncharacterized protein DUF4398